MDFFKGIGNFFGGLFGGNKDDEERKRKQQQAQQQQQQQQQAQPRQFIRPNQYSQTNFNTGFSQNTPTLQPFKPQNNIPNQQNQQNSLVSLVQDKPQQPKPQLTAKQMELDSLYRKNLDAARKQQRRGMGFFDNIADSLAGGAAEKRAQVQARGSAVNQYQEKHGWNADKDIIKFNDITTNMAKANSDASREALDRTNKTRDYMEEWVNTASNVPIIGSVPAGVVKVGTTLTGGLATATGNDKYANELNNSLIRMQLGMGADELRRLPVEQQRKLEAMRGLDLALTPLDYIGVSGIAKSPLLAATKKAAIEGAKNRSISSGTKQALIDGAKTEGKNVALFGGAGGALSAGAQGYLTGSVDPAQVAKDATVSGLLAPLFSGPSSRARSGVRRGIDNMVHEAEPNAPAIHENSPVSPVVETPTQKPSGISSPNRPEGMNKAQNFPTKPEPQPVVTQPVPRPEPQPVQPRPEPAYQTPPQTLQDAIGDINDPLAPQRPVEPVQAPESPLQPIQRQLDEQMLEPPRQEVVTPPQVVDTPAQVQARQVQELNATQPRLTPEQVAEIEARQAVENAPTEAMADLMSEARKYGSAEEFADSLNAMKYGKVTGVGQLPVSKINKTQIKALTERGLPHTDTNLKVSDFKPGRQVTQPLEVYSKGGSWVVENGNHRLAQALANGDETVPVVFKGGEGKKYSTPITDLYNQAHAKPTPTEPKPAPKAQTNTPKQKPPVDMKPLEEATERGAKDQIKKDAQNVAKGEWAGKSLDEAAKKQKKSEPAKSLKEPIDTKPPVDDSPAPASTKSGENYLQRTVSSDSSTSDVKRRLMSISDSVDSNDIDEIMDNIPKASQKIKDQIRKHYDTIEASEHGINRIQKEFRTDVADGSTGKISREVAEEMAHKRNKYTQDMQIAEKNLQSLIRKVEGRQSFKKRMLNSASNLVSYQQGNMLAGLPTQEKNIIGDIIATATQGVRHPIKTIKGVPEARFGSEMKKALRETTQVLPKTVSEVPRYIIRSVLSPVYAINNSLANVRGAVFRSTAARTELARAGFKNLTPDQIRVQELRAGNAREVLINLNKNVGSTITDPYKAAKASDEYFKVLDTATSHKDLARFAENTRKSSGILQEMMAGKNANGEVTPMSLLVNTLYPFTNPAINAGKKAIYMLDPRKASHVNEIKSILQSPTQRNVARMQKMAGTAASIVAISQLLDDGVIAYNDEQTTGDVSKPAGWSIKTGDDTYVPVRALGMFEPFVAAVGVTHKVMNGEVKTPEDGMAMMANSLPVVGANQFYGDAVRDIAKGDFTGYGVQSQAINRVKNLVPGVNNGLNRWMDRNQGKSTDSFSAYASKKDASGKTVPDFSTWLGNSVKMGFGDTEGLKPSLTTAGQRRTADNQGAFVKKTTNDPATKQHNGAISNLTKYAQEQGLGKTMDDMFGTFDSDTGESKGSHFSTIQSAIWANTGKGGKETMLKSDKKMYDLSQQVLNGVRGDGDELLTIGGENLYSDVSMPNSKGSKNSSKPVSMASVKNAIAAASLPSDKKDELYQISQEASGLYDRRKAGEISWDDEQKMRSELADRERAIVQSSDGVKKLNGLMDKLEKEGFFEEGGLGSTRSGQTYLWNSLNAMLGEKGKTPAADWDDNKSSSGKGGRRSGGRSGSGSGSGGKARGYNMPTSLLSSKSNSAPDIKRGERLFKAPTLVSTAEKTKSRIPNISVKKGIHL